MLFHLINIKKTNAVTQYCSQPLEFNILLKIQLVKKKRQQQRAYLHYDYVTFKFKVKYLQKQKIQFSHCSLQQLTLLC